MNKLFKVLSKDYNFYFGLLIYIGFFLQLFYFTMGDENQKYFFILVFFFVFMIRVFMLDVFIIGFSIAYFYNFNSIHDDVNTKIISVLFFIPYVSYNVYRNIDVFFLENYRDDLIKKRKRESYLEMEMNFYLKSKKIDKKWNDINEVEKENLLKEYEEYKRKKKIRQDKETVRYEKEIERERIEKENEEIKRDQILKEKERIKKNFK